MIIAATKDADAAIADEAVSLLCGWPTADALPEILKLTASGRTQILAVRGALRLIPLQAVSDEQKLAAFKRPHASRGSRGGEAAAGAPWGSDDRRVAGDIRNISTMRQRRTKRALQW